MKQKINVKIKEQLEKMLKMILGTPRGNWDIIKIGQKIDHLVKVSLILKVQKNIYNVRFI